MEMRRALIIGNDDYDVSPLRGCVSDAREMAKALKVNGDDSKNFDVNFKTNIKTTRELRNLISDLFSDNADIALLYFSGHGNVDQGGGSLIALDYKNSAGLSMSDVMRIANKSTCKNKIIILDCCYAACIGDTDSGSANNISELGAGVTVLAACSSNECACEIGEHGVFTSLLLQALDGKAANILGDVTLGSIYSYIDQALGTWEQRPVFKTNVSQFVSIKKFQPKVSLSVIKSMREYFKTAEDLYSLNPSYERTNSKNIQHKVIVPYALETNVNIFENLQKLESIGLVEPVEESHMYFAAMNSKSCRLTPLGQYYWSLIDKERL